MMRTCFVPLCDAKNKDQPNRTMFSVPKNSSLFAQWAANLPNVKQLRQSDRVCYLHFKPEDVEYTFIHVINGEVYEIKRDRPRLKPNAVPCLKMTTKEELLNYRVKSREAKMTKTCNESLNQHLCELIGETQHFDNENEKAVNENIQKKDSTIENTTEVLDIITTADDQTETLSDMNDQIDLIIEESSDVCNDNNAAYHEDNLAILNVFKLLYDNIYKVLTPNTLWGLHRCPNRSAICFSYMDITKMQITKIISIRADGLISLFANACLINTIRLVKEIDDLDQLSILINQVDMWRFCLGQSTNESCEIVVKPENCWNSDEDEQVYICKACAQKS